jgi:hypothetical protein
MILFYILIATELTVGLVILNNIADDIKEIMKEKR